MLTLISWFSSSAIIFGGIMPYVPQYLDIKRTESAKGFSIYVCLVLLLANTLRILYWFGHWFELPLLIQSIIMNITMILLLALCVSVENKEQPYKDRVFTDLNLKDFWNWSDSQSYLEFLVFFTLVGGVLMYAVIDHPVYAEVFGFLSLSMESMLGMPQFYRNYLVKSTYGMSRKMVLMWLCGDIFKTVYYFVKNVPIPFLVFGNIQIIIDIAVLSQCYFYGNQNLKYSKLSF